MFSALIAVALKESETSLEDPFADIPRMTITFHRIALHVRHVGRPTSAWAMHGF